MLNKNKKILSSIALTAVFLSGCELIPVEEVFQAAPIIQVEENQEYEQAVVMRGDLINTEDISCKYVPTKTERLSFPISGAVISAIHVEAGEVVSAGQLLAELEESNVDVQIEAQKYQIQTLQLQIAHLKENQNLGLDLQSAQVTAVQSQQKAAEERLAQIAERLKQIEAEMQAAEAEETQPAPEAGTETVPETQPEESELAILAEEQAVLLQEQSELTQMVKAYTQELTGLEQEKNVSGSSYQNQMQNYEDALYIAQLHLEALQKAQRERRLYAGIDGMVTYAKLIGDNTYCEEGKTVIEISDMNTMTFVVTGENAAYFPIGTKTVVTCNKTEYEVEAVEANQLGLPEPEEGEQVAYLHVPNPDATLENGDKGNITITLEQSLDTLYLDKNAVHTMEGKHFVYILNEEGLRSMQYVTVGIESEGRIEIKDGLAEGDSVILDAN